MGTSPAHPPWAPLRSSAAGGASPSLPGTAAPEHRTLAVREYLLSKLCLLNWETGCFFFFFLIKNVVLVENICSPHKMPCIRYTHCGPYQKTSGVLPKPPGHFFSH